MGAWRPKHVEWLCRNKTCTVLHQVGVSFDLYYDTRKHKIKIYYLHRYPSVRISILCAWSIPVDARSKAWVCGRSLCSTVGSNTAGVMEVCCVVCCQVEVSASGWSPVQSSPTDCGASLCVIVKPRQWRNPGPLGAVARWRGWHLYTANVVLSL